MSAEAGAWHLDVVRDVKRINAHLVAALAYPILEREGELRRAGLPATSDLMRVICACGSGQTDLFQKAFHRGAQVPSLARACAA